MPRRAECRPLAVRVVAVMAQVLPSPRHFEQASQLVAKESTARSVACGPKADVHVDAFTPYADAGFDEVYVANIGPHSVDMMNFYRTEVLPELRLRKERSHG